MSLEYVIDFVTSDKFGSFLSLVGTLLQKLPLGDNIKIMTFHRLPVKVSLSLRQ